VSLRPVRREGIAVRHNRESREVSVEVRPVPVPGGRERCFLILFEEAQRSSRPPSRPATGKGGARALRDSEVLKLQNELASTRQYKPLRAWRRQNVSRRHGTTHLWLGGQCLVAGAERI